MHTRAPVFALCLLAACGGEEPTPPGHTQVDAAVTDAMVVIDAMTAIDEWQWPGNVRELENRMKRAVIMAEGKLIGAEDLDLGPQPEDALPFNLKAAREYADRQAIR